MKIPFRNALLTSLSALVIGLSGCGSTQLGSYNRNHDQDAGIEQLLDGGAEDGGIKDGGCITKTFYLDADNDSYGDPTKTKEACTPPQNYVLNNLDCNDNEATKWQLLTGYPDSDNDGYTLAASRQVCSGSSLPKGYKALPSALSDCDDNNVNIHPGAPEVCDGKNNNCNGSIDEWLTLEQPCGVSDVGECRLDVEYNYCRNGQYTGWQGCTAVFPAEEICDGKNNDCDPSTLDGSGELPPLNFLQNGVCAGSQQTCSRGNWQSNYSGVTHYEATETSCDNLDNDCDGLTDENLTQLCSSICGEGLETCVNGEWRNCTAPQPITNLLNEFSNSQTIEELVFSGNENIIRYLDLDKNVEVNNATINLKGLQNYIEQDEGIAFYSSRAISPVEACHDGNWDTYCAPRLPPYAYGDIQETFKIIPDLVESKEDITLDFIVKLYYGNSQGKNITISFYNYTNENWLLYAELTNPTAIYDIFTAHLNDGQDIISNDGKFTSKVDIDAFSGNEKGCYFEAKIRVNSFPKNPYLEIGIPDGTPEWNWSGQFKESDGIKTAGDFSDKVNSYLINCTPDGNNRCQVPVTFHSDLLGKLECSKINITYLSCVE